VPEELPHYPYAVVGLLTSRIATAAARLLVSGQSTQPAGTRQRLYLIASRNAGVVVIVSALALMVRSPMLGSLAQYGISPQRISTSSRSPVSRFSLTMGWKVCGATFQLGPKSGTDGP
jgi:hypothetical protein